MARSPVNTEAIDYAFSTLATMFLIRAQEFISSQDAHAAKRFVHDHPAINRIDPLSHLQAILDDLGLWNPQVIPYIQDLPYRARSILVEQWYS
jgi:hypothetical protein